ncbi:ribose-5-phosphate isomerase RpiA [Aquibacillus kalidii]|uniref:ribose-5-phosphate isomerase RpiA n=1 Tax=Aquibacillus kalidii TaxID=2762597 RepID=UPI00164642F7|nr:ribose-5-phosphate isomerase RpiA [Aquibacillus kalidii]
MSTKSKQLAGEKATEFIKDGMVLGLGTGSTVYWTIQKLGELVKGGLNIQGVPTSKQTEKLANQLDIPLLSLSDVNDIDLTIDGADEANSNLELIKGGGGALLREKMIASISRRLVIVVDQSKYVPELGHFPLPVEIVPFGWEITSKQIAALGCLPQLRREERDPVVTDNGNYIVDCHFNTISDAKQLDQALNMIPGVVENGLFVDMANELIIGRDDGTIDFLST